MSACFQSHKAAILVGKCYSWVRTDGDIYILELSLGHTQESIYKFLSLDGWGVL